MEGKNIDKGNLKSIHDLSRFQFVNVFLLCFFFHTQLFCVHSSNLILTCSDSGFSTIEPRPDFLRSSLRINRYICIHNSSFANSGCKFNNLF